MLPLTDLVYDYRTDVKDDSFTVVTTAGNTTPLVVLTKYIYNADTGTIEVQSDLSTDSPLFSSYNTTTRATVFSGMTGNATRTLEVSYDTDALGTSGALSTFVDRIAWIYMLMIIAFAPASIAAIFTGRA